jgi:hypothetical protein
MSEVRLRHDDGVFIASVSAWPSSRNSTPLGTKRDVFVLETS